MLTVIDDRWAMTATLQNHLRDALIGIVVVIALLFVVVTGVSAGLGVETARALAAH